MYKILLDFVSVLLLTIIFCTRCVTHYIILLYVLCYSQSYSVSVVLLTIIHIIVFKQAEIGARRDTPKVSFSKFNTFSQHGIIKLNHHFTFHLHTTLSILHQILRNEKQTTLRQNMSRGCCWHCTRNTVSYSYSACKVPLRTCGAAS